MQFSSNKRRLTLYGPALATRNKPTRNQLVRHDKMHDQTLGDGVIALNDVITRSCLSG